MPVFPSLWSWLSLQQAGTSQPCVASEVSQGPTQKDHHLSGSRVLSFPLPGPLSSLSFPICDPHFFPAPQPWKAQLSPNPLLAERRIRVGLLRPPAACNGWAGGSRVPRLAPWVAQPRAAGEAASLALLPSAPGREAEDEWPWPQGGGGAGSPGPGLAALGCAGLWEPIWQRPEPFEAFCGCWLFLPPSPFQRLLSEPRQETSGTTLPPHPPPPGRFGKQRSS